MGYRRFREICSIRYEYYPDDRDSRFVFIVGTFVLDCIEMDRQTDATIRISNHVFNGCEEVEVETRLLRMNPFADV